MKLQHLNLCVNNLTDSQDFFESIFGFQTMDRKGDAIAVMEDGHDFVLVLSNPQIFGDEVPVYPKDFHIGFFVDTPDKVNQMYDRLQLTANVELDSKPKYMRGGYSLYFRALNGILFEITCLQK
ncbi:VOC family protein [Shimazuella alba]|uniref:VOC family protein n=1 Tax=Shimazuella alba TaxID=2690964 RepID=A0A6I4W192_9BACL|nr:VOC family protein [Shimazuella alba]MXQ55955.1 VOC family protein [Shimazuella alba]